MDSSLLYCVCDLTYLNTGYFAMVCQIGLISNAVTVDEISPDPQKAEFEALCTELVVQG